MRRRSVTAILVIAFFLGLVLLIYPSFSDWYNRFHQGRVVLQYAEQASKIPEEQAEEMKQAAVAYNEKLAERGINWEPTDEELKVYKELLDVDGGVMAYIEIPKINVMLPIYHGTSDEVLQRSIGHIEGSSLPVGGESTHCLLSGHRGLPSARLFTDLDRLQPGDIFIIRTLNDVLTYEVERINEVKPHDLSLVTIKKGKDLCTLITCTPYGINTHRLLVRGHRITTAKEAIRIVPADALQVEPRLIAIGFAMPALLALALTVLLKKRKMNPD